MEAAPDRDQETPERDMVRDTRKSHGAEEDRLELPEPVEPVFRHHAAGLGVALAAPVERRPLDVEAEPASGRVEDAHALGHDFFADSVTRNRGNTVSHARTSVRPSLRRVGLQAPPPARPPPRAGPPRPPPPLAPPPPAAR